MSRTTAITELRRTHVVGRHLLRHGDDGPDWCVRCGTFSPYLRRFDGSATDCRPIARAARWWHPNPRHALADLPEDLRARQLPENTLP